MERSAARTPIWFWIAFATLALVYVAAATVRPIYGHDASVYQGLSDAILAGRGYVFGDLPHTQYPPGQPLLLAAVRGLGGDLLTAQRIVALLAVFAAWLCHRWLSNGRRELALAVPLLFLASTATFRQSIAGLRSEPLFLALTLGLLCSIDASRRAGRADGRTVLVAAMLAAAATATRTVGVALVGAAVLTMAQGFVRRTPDQPPRASLAAVAIGGLLAFGAWTVWSSALAAPMYDGDSLYSYVAQLRLVDPHEPDLGQANVVQILLRLPGAALAQLGHVVAILTNAPWVHVMFGSPAIALVAALLVVGTVRLLRGPDAFVGWYWIAFLGILGVWPYDEGTRFVLPLLPVLLLLAWRGGTAVVAWFAGARPSQRRILLASVGAAGLAIWVADVSLTGRTIGKQAIAYAVVWGALVPSAFLPMRWSARAVRRAAAVLLTMWIVGFVVLGVWRGYAIWRSEAEPAAAAARMDHLVEAIHWLRENAPPESVVMCEQYAAVYVGSGLPSVPLPRTGDADVLAGAVEAAEVDYLIVQDTPEHPYYLPVEERRLEVLRDRLAPRLRIVHRYTGGRIFSVEHSR